VTQSDGQSSAAAHGREAVGRHATAAGVTAAVVGTCLFRYLTIEFTNDHFVHLSRARQIVQGDVPVRDFFDPGLLLHYYASAAALLWPGRYLFGEAILTIGFIAAGVGLTFVVAARLSRSFWPAAMAAFITALAMPRLYNYPKAFLYVLAIAGAWSYARRPRGTWLLALAAITVLAFLFRHDHGVYVGLSILALLVIRHSGTTREAAWVVSRYILITLALLSPFLMFIAATAGLDRYVAGVLPQAMSASTSRLLRFPVIIDRSAPLLAIAPPVERRINVRWATDLDEDGRVARERRLGLVSPAQVEGTTWSYTLTREDREHVGAVIDDPAALDTHGINRAQRMLDVPDPLYLRLQREHALLRLRLAPGVFTTNNAVAWFYYVALLMPVLGLTLLAWKLRHHTIERPEAAVAGMLAVLSIVIVQTLVRGSPDSRLPDVAGPICVLSAWVIARGLRPARSARATQRVWATAAAIFGVVSVWSVGTNAAAMASLESSQILGGAPAVWSRMQRVTHDLQTRPVDTWTRDSPGLRGLMRYVFDCTAPTDRVLVTWFAPQVFFYAERAFAGGQVYLTPGWHASPADQRLTIERLSRQRAPIVLDHVDSGYPIYFPLVAEYLQGRYVEIPIRAESMQEYRVLADRGLTAIGTYDPLGLPCFR
jgi:hypothetical protein